MQRLIRGNRCGRLVTFDWTRIAAAVMGIVVVAQALALIMRATCDPAHRHPLVTFGRTAPPGEDDPEDDVKLSISLSLSEAFQPALDPCAPIQTVREAPPRGVKGHLFRWMKRRERKASSQVNDVESVPEPPVPNSLNRSQSLRMGIRF